MNTTPGYWYLASPYSNHPEGYEAAFTIACRASGILLSHGIANYAPIVMGHPLIRHVPFDPANFRHWEVQNHALMQGARGLIMLMAEGWDTSRGMEDELDWFDDRGKPVIYMRPGVLPEEDLCRFSPEPATDQT